jgi:hypothetical protein
MLMSELCIVHHMIAWRIRRIVYLSRLANNSGLDYSTEIHNLECEVFILDRTIGQYAY